MRKTESSPSGLRQMLNLEVCETGLFHLIGWFLEDKIGEEVVDEGEEERFVLVHCAQVKSRIIIGGGTNILTCLVKKRECYYILYTYYIPFLNQCFLCYSRICIYPQYQVIEKKAIKEK